MSESVLTLIDCSKKQLDLTNEVKVKKLIFSLMVDIGTVYV